MKKNHTRKRLKRHSLSASVIIAYGLLAVILIASLNIVVGIQYNRSVVARYGERANAYTRIAADYIDGDKVQTYIETGETDAYYDTVQSFLNSHQKEGILQYYYVGYLDGDDVVYIWDANNEISVSALFDREALTADEIEEIQYEMENPDSDGMVVTRDSYGYLGTAVSPIETSDGTVVAFVAADILMSSVDSEVRSFLVPMIALIIFVIGGSSIIGYYIIDIRLVQPIHRLTKEAEDMVTHLTDRDDVRINLQTDNDLEDLGDAFNQMYEDVTTYIKQLKTVTREKERIGTELKVATQIQADMLPKIFPYRPDRPEFDLYATMTPAKEVGGDFYDYFMVDEDHLAVVIGDVSGKGVPAALFMVISKTLIKNFATMKLPVDEIFNRANRELCDGNKSELFTTAWIGIYEISTHRLCYADAGHETALVRKPDGTLREIKPKKKNIVLAAMDGITYALNETTLDTNEMLLLYTDGVPEATNANEELFGMERLKAALAKYDTKDPEDLLTVLKQEVDSFVDGAPQFDDITMLALIIHEDR